MMVVLNKKNKLWFKKKNKYHLKKILNKKSLMKKKINNQKIYLKPQIKNKTI